MKKIVLLIVFIAFSSSVMGAEEYAPGEVCRSSSTLRQNPPKTNRHSSSVRPV